MAAQTYESHDELDQPQASDGLGNWLIIITSIVLVIAFIMVQKGMAERFNAGMFGDPAAKPAAK